jgi:hypothetical protein
MGYKAEGKIEKIFDTEQKSASFSAREFVIEVTEGQYPQMVKFQLVQDKVTLIDEFSEGDTVEVEFDLRGREWNGKYFTNLQAWRISRAGEGGGKASGQAGNQSGGERSAGGNPQAQSTTRSQSASVSNNSDFDDDIPF